MTRRWRDLVLGVALIGLLLWAAPTLIAWQLQVSPAPPEAPVSPAALDALISEMMPTIPATLLAEEDQDGVRYAVYQVPAGRSPMDAAEEVRTAATARGLEVYAYPVDGLDAQIRAYAGPSLRQELLLIPTLPDAPPVPPSTTRRERPLIALIIAGLGETNAPWLSTTAVPLTVAIQPYTPFALHLGEKAALAWHEVIVDLNGEREAMRDRDQLQQAMDAIPFATGVLSDVRLQMALPNPFAIFVQTNDRGRPPVALRNQWLPAQRSQRRTATETLARTRVLAARDGAAALVISASDPALRSVLDWAREEARDSGAFRLALASEVLRADQTRGINVEPRPE